MSTDTFDAIQKANDLYRTYQRDNLALTLRQMFYRFVALDYFSNQRRYKNVGGDRWVRDSEGTKNAPPNYKWLGEILTAARYDGSFPVFGLEDRGRSVNLGDFDTYDDDIDQAVENCTYYFQKIPEWVLNTSRWWGQSTYVNVWVEKDALAGVFAPVCKKLGVGWFPCHGYPSVSALASWAEGWQNLSYLDHIERAVVLYFGDHDPDGWEIPRSAERNLRKIIKVQGWRPKPFTFERVALNMDQIEEFNPPPFEAKVSSARCAGYVREHGTTDAWELDALEPRKLQALIQERVSEYFDEDICQRERADLHTRRGKVLLELASNPDRVSEQFTEAYRNWEVTQDDGDDDDE